MRLITREGRGIIANNPDGDKVPLELPSLSGVIADCKFIGHGEEITCGSELNGQIIGLFFSVPTVRFILTL